jgi:hypothetical protein
MEKTGWIPMSDFYTGETMEIRLGKGIFLDNTGTLVLSVGIEFRSNLMEEEIVGEKWKGAGKILAVG